MELPRSAGLLFVPCGSTLNEAWVVRQSGAICGGGGLAGRAIDTEDNMKR